MDSLYTADDDYFIDSDFHDMDLIDFSLEMIKTIDGIDKKKEKGSVWKSLKSQVTSLEGNIHKQKEKIQHTLDSPNFLRTKDKLAFVIGVVNCMLTPYLLGAHTQLVALYYSIKAIILIGFRFLTYKRLNWHYFLFDFCYFANFCLLMYLHFFYDNGIFFVICFAMTNGPLAWAVPTWRNSMVFHSIDKVTSIFIHIGPPVVAYAIRWHHKSHYPTYSICPNDDCDIPFYYFVFLPLIPYITWQILYYIKVNVLSSHKDRMTSAKWILEEEKGGFIAKLSSYPFGEQYNVFGFMLFQLVYTIFTLVPIKFLWDNQLFHLTFLTFIVLVSIWNGANYYFEVFSRRYIESLEQKEKKLSELKKIINDHKTADQSTTETN